MAYVDTYRIASLNQLVSLTEVILSKKDGDAESVTTFSGVNINFKYLGNEGKFVPIFPAVLEVEFWVKQEQADPWQEFAEAEENTWQVRFIYNGVPRFYGYLVPEENSAPVRDKPYSIRFTASDRIGAMKGRPLTKADGTEFTTHHSIIEYISAITQLTGLNLPIRIYDNVFHRSMLNRDDDYKHDFASQAFVEYRTFLKDAVTFQDAYKCLEIICKRNFRFFQWEGKWILIRLPMIQFTHFVGYYTEYDYTGHNQVGYEYLDNYAMVGKDESIFPVNVEQRKTLKAAMKSAKTVFNYVQWPELPKNNKFERGELIDTTELTDPPRTLKRYTIPSWNYGSYSGFPSQEAALPALTPDTSTAWRQTTFSQYGVEIEREVVLEEVSSGIRGMLVSEGMPVKAGDKVNVKFDYKLSFSGTGNQQIAMIFLLPDAGGTKWVIDVTTAGIYYWKQATAGSFISKNYAAGENFDKYSGFNVDPQEIPVDGNLYIGFITPGVIGSKAYFKNLSVEYRPYVAGGYLQVKGHYWITTQDTKYSSTSEDEVFLSDGTRKIMKGCLLDVNGIPFTEDWYRMGVSESKHYLQLVNIGDFNMEHRRMLFKEGPYKQLTYAPQNNPTQAHAVGLHKQYRHMDESVDRRYMLGAPLNMNYKTGHVQSRFYEVFEDGKDDGQANGVQEFKYIFST